MDFTLSKQQQMVQKMYREFAENEVKPLAKKVDAEEYFPKETVEKMGKLGMMGIYFPTEVGGAGGDVLSYVMAVEELSKVCGTTGVIVSAHTSLCAAPIYENGTPEQKAKYLPKLCSGEWLGAFGLTEPGAGTDAQGQQTIAKEDGDYWVLNGSKIFITNAGFADVFIVIAVTDNVLDKRGRPTKLCSAFIVERTDPGFSVGKAEDKMGIRGSSTCELIFEDCRIPKDRMLGVRGKGFQLAMATLDGGRIGIASQALGIAEGALEETVAYVKERKQFGRSISAFQNTQFELAEMKARVEAAKYLGITHHALDGVVTGVAVTAEQLQAAAGHIACGAGCDQLCLSSLDAVTNLLAVHCFLLLQSSSVDQILCSLNACLHLSQLELGVLECGNAAAELLALLDVSNGLFQSALGNAQSLRCDTDTAAVQSSHSQLEAAATHTQHTVSRDAAVLKDQLAGGRTADAHLVLSLTDGEARVGALHDKGGALLGGTAPPVSSSLLTPACVLLLFMKMVLPSRRQSICPSCAAVSGWVLSA